MLPCFMHFYSQNKAGRLPLEVAVLDSHDDGSATALLQPTFVAKAVELNGVIDAQTGCTLLHLTALHKMCATTAVLVKAGADVSVKECV